MYRRVAMLLVVALAVSLVTMGVAGAKKPKPTTTTVPPVIVLTPEQIGTAMLALSDASIGWSALPPSPFEPNANNGFCNGPNADARAQTLGVTNTATAGFTQDPNSGPSIGQRFYEFPTEAAATSFIDQSRAQAKSCPSWSEARPSGAQVTWTPSELSFPQGSAEQSFALRLTGTSQTSFGQGSSFIQDQVAMRIDNHVFTVSRTGSGTDPDQLNTYVGKALTKLGAATQLAKASTTTTTIKKKKKKR